MFVGYIVYVATAPAVRLVGVTSTVDGDRSAADGGE